MSQKFSGDVMNRTVGMNTHTSCRYLKLDSSLGTTLNVFPSKYLVRETQAT